LACPIIDAACSVSVAVFGTEPRYAGKPRSRSMPTPSAAAAVARSACETLSWLEMNAVLQEFAKAVLSGMVPTLSAG
jgi:hypothetical protein